MKQYEIRLACISILLTAVASNGQRLTTTNAPATIPWSQIGAKAGADYKGDGLAVTPTQSGARLHCGFQRLDGEATTRGLWLTSTVTNTVSDRFRVTAMEAGRKAADATLNSQYPESRISLEEEGEVSVCGQTVRFSRPGLTEEYSVSMDGVRQDFIVEQPPSSPPAGELVVTLDVAGAKVEPAAYGARLALENSGRKIAYTRLRVTDATGKELAARIEASSAEVNMMDSTSWSDGGSIFEELSVHPDAATEAKLALVVNDVGAVYPVRIDPTFSDANWISMGVLPGTDGDVYASTVDGSGNLYIGGVFTTAGGSTANDIAQWNGSSWSALGSGMNNTVYALTMSGGTLYAGGDFTTAGGAAANDIAQWNGSSWSALGSGMSNVVYALAVSGGTLYAGGDFATAGGTPANDIAQWNGSSWSAVGLGMNGFVDALAASGSTLYAGGGFTTAGGSAANDIAQWNGSSWSALGSGMNNDVYALAVSGGTLSAGGNFTTAGGVAVNDIAQWNGSSWSPLGSGVNNVVYALAVSGGTLYAAGDFTTAGGMAANNIAQWNGSSWSGLGSGMNNAVNALAVSVSTLYAGGDFAAAGVESLNGLYNYIAQWNGSTWSGMGSGIAFDVDALAVSGSTLYAGGIFVDAGGDTNANCIAQWNGSSWSAVGSGLNYTVSALAVSGSTLYAGGIFDLTGSGVRVNSIAQWNGSSWSPLGSGMNRVNALAVSGSTLYAAGYFSTAGGVAANNIAQWNGSSWSALGSGIGDPRFGQSVSALAVSGSTLYAGGLFTAAGGSPASGVAQWNGRSWSALGSGIPGVAAGDGEYVYALAVSGSTLYVGGIFGGAGGVSANNIAQWNGSSWSALGSGMNSDVFALAVSGSTLYAGGWFTAADGVAANYIAQWNGSSWSALGSGVSGAVLQNSAAVYALAVSGSALYAGGVFSMAGTNASASVAEANLAGTPVPLTIITTNSVFGLTNGVFGFDVSGPVGSNVVIQASADLKIWIPLQTNLLDSSPLYFSDSQSPTNRPRFYRAVLP
jgi:hypothetical protein